MRQITIDWRLLLPIQNIKEKVCMCNISKRIRISSVRCYSTMLMKEGFGLRNSKPITLEATTAHSRDTYAHQGFEVRQYKKICKWYLMLTLESKVVETLTLGRGQVDNRGLKTRDKESSVGFTVWIMIRVCFRYSASPAELK